MTKKIVVPKGWKPIGFIERKSEPARTKDIKKGTVVGVIVMTQDYDTEILLEPSFADGDPMTRATVFEAASYIVGDEFDSSLEKIGEYTPPQNKTENHIAESKERGND
jgi:hypothetical protein